MNPSKQDIKLKLQCIEMIIDKFKQVTTCQSSEYWLDYIKMYLATVMVRHQIPFEDFQKFLDKMEIE